MKYKGGTSIYVPGKIPGGCFGGWVLIQEDDGNPEPGFVTNAHVVHNTQPSQQIKTCGDNVNIGKVMYASVTDKTDEYDVALCYAENLEVIDEGIKELSGIAVLTWTEPKVDMEISYYSPVSSKVRHGKITDIGQGEHYKAKSFYYTLDGDGCTKPGDSGSLIVEKDSNPPVIVGLLWGRTGGIAPNNAAHAFSDVCSYLLTKKKIEVLGVRD